MACSSTCSKLRRTAQKSELWGASSAEPLPGGAVAAAWRRLGNGCYPVTKTVISLPNPPIDGLTKLNINRKAFWSIGVFHFYLISELLPYFTANFSLTICSICSCVCSISAPSVLFLLNKFQMLQGLDFIYLLCKTFTYTQLQLPSSNC